MQRKVENVICQFDLSNDEQGNGGHKTGLYVDFVYAPIMAPIMENIYQLWPLQLRRSSDS